MLASSSSPSRRPSESFEPCASTNAETIELIRHSVSLCCQCGSDNSLDGGTLPPDDLAQVKSSSFQQFRRVRETTDQTTLRLLVFSVRETSVCVTSNGTGFQVHDTTRNDDAHFCCASGLFDKFPCSVSEQPETHQRTGLAETAVPTTTTVPAHFGIQ